MEDLKSETAPLATRPSQEIGKSAHRNTTDPALSWQQALDNAGIVLRRYRAGTHRTACPQCNRGSRDDAFAVTIEVDGAWVGYCHRCQWSPFWRRRGPMPERPVSVSRPGMRRETLQRPLDLYLWNRCQPITTDCPVGRYLIGRGCALPAPHAVRWGAGEGGDFPQMVGLISDVLTAEPISLHFTSINHDGSGKAPIDRPRRYLAGHRKAGAVVRLTEDAEVTTGLVIGEGLETCLTAAREIAPVWCCLDAGNLAAFPVLPGVEALTVLVDHDPAGEKAAAAVRERWETAGREVILLRPPTPGTDINDYANAMVRR